MFLTCIINTQLLSNFKNDIRIQIGYVNVAVFLHDNTVFYSQNLVDLNLYDIICVKMHDALKIDKQIAYDFCQILFHTTLKQSIFFERHVYKL